MLLRIFSLSEVPQTFNSLRSAIMYRLNKSGAKTYHCRTVLSNFLYQLNSFSDPCAGSLLVAQFLDQCNILPSCVIIPVVNHIDSINFEEYFHGTDTGKLTRFC